MYTRAIFFIIYLTSSVATDSDQIVILLIMIVLISKNDNDTDNKKYENLITDSDSDITQMISVISLIVKLLMIS